MIYNQYEMINQLNEELGRAVSSFNEAQYKAAMALANCAENKNLILTFILDNLRDSNLELHSNLTITTSIGKNLRLVKGTYKVSSYDGKDVELIYQNDILPVRLSEFDDNSLSAFLSSVEFEKLRKF